MHNPTWKEVQFCHLVVSLTSAANETCPKKGVDTSGLIEEMIVMLLLVWFMALRHLQVGLKLSAIQKQASPELEGPPKTTNASFQR